MSDKERYCQCGLELLDAPLETPPYVLDEGFCSEQCYDDAVAADSEPITSMKVKLVFEDWQKDGKSVYNTPDGMALSVGNLHSGTTFDATVYFDPDSELDINIALDAGFAPIFRVIKGDR